MPLPVLAVPARPGRLPRAGAPCRGAALFLLVLPALAIGAHAQPPATELEPVTVEALRLHLDAGEVPAALDLREITPGAAGQPGAGLAEVVATVPGLLMQERQNHAQDAQLSIRGFGARSSFGVRGVRLYVDGIPATLPDGQGQAAAFNLDLDARLGVLRGPFSVLHGNAAGGVVELWSTPGSAGRETRLGLSAGSHAALRQSLASRGSSETFAWNMALAHGTAGGYREHSRMRRNTAHARLDWTPAGGGDWILVLDHLAQPRAQDPKGLTAAQLRADPRQAAPAALAWNTRKSIRQDQVGLVHERALGSTDRLRVATWAGSRRIEQYLSIPRAAQRPALHSGGVVAPATNYAGIDLRWSRDGRLAGGDAELVLGLGGEFQRQHRRGWENFLGDRDGIKGALRRDEMDNVDSLAPYAQWSWHPNARWLLLLGLRQDRVRFRMHDRYVTPGNPDDSGRVGYHATMPVAGLAWRPRAGLRLHAGIGRGFETPTWTELAYRRDGAPGLALDLAAARVTQLEAGLQARLHERLTMAATLFRADSRRELAVAGNGQGRTTYQNVGRTRRAGMELSAEGTLGAGWRLQGALTRLQASFRDGFLTCATTPCAEPELAIPAGNRLPGVPRTWGAVELAREAGGWEQGLALAGRGRMFADDANTAAAAGAATLDAWLVRRLRLASGAQLELSLRVDNLADRRHIGSVIVNAGGGEYFEPAPGRTASLGMQLRF